MEALKRCLGPLVNVREEKTGTFYISVSVRTWTRAFGPLVGHGSSKNLEYSCFVIRRLNSNVEPICNEALDGVE